MSDLLTAPAPAVRPRTADVMIALRDRYCPPEYALFEEVGDSGSGSRVYADGVAVNMWASRGYAITGFEVKVSRSDWLRELKQPDKAEPVLTKCDYWYLVAPDDVYMPDEVPVSWGILSFKDGKLREKRKAPKLEPKPVTRAFLAQMFRRGHAAEERDISARIAKALADDRAAMEKRIAERVRSETSLLRDEAEKWGRLCSELGENKWMNDGEFIAAVKAVRTAGLASTYYGLPALLEQMKTASVRLERAIAIFRPAEADDAGVSFYIHKGAEKP